MRRSRTVYRDGYATARARRARGIVTPWIGCFAGLLLTSRFSIIIVRTVMAPWMQEVRSAVENRLRSFLKEKRREAEQLSSSAVELLDAIEELTLRGGKRMRPVVLVAGYRAVRSKAGSAELPRSVGGFTELPQSVGGFTELPQSVVSAGAAIEMLQSYLLIHDDWMDLDDERRGGPSVYGLMRRKHRDDHLGASMTVLAGDLAAAYAGELMTGVDASDGAPFSEVLSVYWQLQQEVLMGQQLDMLGHEDIERTYDLKTASYTVRGPVLLGGLLGGATVAQQAALTAFATPLGIAFQLRDEILGTFGDPAATGKPSGNDLRAGKATLVLREARKLLGEDGFQPVRAVLGKADATDGAVAKAVEALTKCGARAHVEAAVEAKLAEAFSALRGGEIDRRPLEEVAMLLVRRDR